MWWRNSHQRVGFATCSAVLMFTLGLSAQSLESELESTAARQLQQTCGSGTYRVGKLCTPCAGTGALTPPSATSETQCFCQPGGTDWYKLRVGCVPCDPGTTSGSANGRVCNCNEDNRWWSPVTGACRPSCDTGFWYDLKTLTCKACPGSPKYTDRFAESESQCKCPPTEIFYYRPGTGCLQCDWDSTTGGSVDGIRCDCMDGYEDFQPDRGVCLSVCPVGYYRDWASRTCFACKGVPGQSVFTFEGPTSARSESECWAWPEDQFYYRLGFGPAVCDPATTTNYSEDGKTCTCKPPFRSWNPATGACVPPACPTSPGQYWGGERCLPCAGPGTVTPKPSGGQSEWDCRCLNTKSYYKVGEGCKPCGALGSFSTKSGDGQVCLCNLGYGNFDPDVGVCEKCPIGTYHSKGSCRDCVYNDATGVVPITPTEGSLSESACMCPTDSGTFYRPGFGCTTCPNIITTGWSDNGKTCTCDPASWIFMPLTGTCRCAPRFASCGKATDPGCCGNLVCKSSNGKPNGPLKCLP